MRTPTVQPHPDSAIGGSIAILLCGGGFWGELRGLLPSLTAQHPWLAIVPEDPQTPIIEESGAEIYEIVPSLVPSRAAGTQLSPRLWYHLIRRYVGILKHYRPTITIGLGANDCLPLAISARLTGTPFVFIESITRVADLSITGKILYHSRLTKRFYVQWRGLESRYPRTIYKGIVHDIRHRGHDSL